MNVCIVIPAYNEGQKIRSVIQGLKSEGLHNLLVIDDGSTDNTSEVVQSENCTVIRMEKNCGQGKSLQIGIEHLKITQNPDVIVTFDADGQHQAEDVKKLVGALQDKNTDVVLGSRFLKKNSRIPFFKKIILKLGVLYTRWTTGLNVTDTHNGLRALNRKAYQSINLTWPRRAHASQILHQIARAQLKYVEVPVNILYPNA